MKYFPTKADFKTLKIRFTKGPSRLHHDSHMESQNNLAVLVYQTNPVVVEQFHVNTVPFLQIHFPSYWPCECKCSIARADDSLIKKC